MTPSVEGVAALQLKLENLTNYLVKLSNATKSDYDKKVIEDCLTKFKKLLDVLSSFNAGNLSFVDVFINEFEIFTAGLIDKIQEASNDFTEFSSNYGSINYIYTIPHKLEENIFIANDACFIRNGSDTHISSLPQVLKDYLKIGEELKNERAVRKLERELSLLKQNSEDSFRRLGYYAAIIGPKFMGKTQTAFTLSHLMNVIYVNLLSIDSNEDANNSDLSSNPSINSVFQKFSKLFSLAIDEDLKDSGDNSIYHIEKHRPGFQTLGLLYCIIRRKQLNFDETAVENFLQMLNINNAVVPKMSTYTFIKKIIDLNINLDENLMFIDEFPANQSDDFSNPVTRKIIFLRNLCRIVQMPSIISSKDATATNYSGPLISPDYDRYQIRWVKVVTRLVQPTLKSICCTIKIRERLMSDFVNDDGTSFDYSGFENFIFGPEHIDVNGLDTAMNILKIIFKNMKTGLPGFYIEAIKTFVDILFEAKTDRKLLENLWQKFCKNLSLKFIDQQIFSTDLESILASVHILGFPCAEKLANEKDEKAAQKVRRHFFYFGNPGDETFDLGLTPLEDANGQYSITRNNEFDMIDLVKLRFKMCKDNKQRLFEGYTEFKYSCHFANVYDDFVLCYCLWNLWYSHDLNQTYSLANLYNDYLKEPNYSNHDYNSDQAVTKSISMELLAFWSIAYASHRDFQGKTPCLEVIDGFIRNLQIFEEGYTKSFDNYQVPDGMELFLKEVSVPYLICGASLPDSIEILQPNDLDFTNLEEAQNAKYVRTDILDIFDDAKIKELITEMAPFVSIGTCYCPKNNTDILFDIKYKGEQALGYIDCILWAKSVNIPVMFPYYKKACLNDYKLSILVCNHIQISLTEGRHKIIKDYWNENKESRINIYAFSYKNDISTSSKTQKGIFAVEAIKEFEDPTGVLILVESSFNSMNPMKK